MNLTPQEKKKFKDPEWRLNHLYRIRTKDQQLIKFKPNPIQSILHKNISGMDMVLKARQVGISTFFLLQKLDKTIFTKNYTSAIISHDRKSMELLFSIIRRAHKYMHPKIQPILEKGGGSRFQLSFPEIDSKIYCTMEAVSDAVNDLHISELALMSGPERFKTSLDAVPTTGNVSIETTPRGFNFFRDMWMDDSSPFTKHFFPWYFLPEYQMETAKLKPTKEERELVKYAKETYGLWITNKQLAFRRFKIRQKDNDLDNFLQEFPENDKTCFIASGQSFFNVRIISKIMDGHQFPPTDGGFLEIYKPVNKTHKYVCGADTAEGVGGDFSVGTIIDCTTMEQVAQLRGQLKPSHFAQELFNLCCQYQKGGMEFPLLGVERNNHGHAVLLELDEHLQYPNLFRHKDERVGWVTDRVSKPIMLNALKDGLENQTLKINSKQLFSEVLTLINNNGKIEASEGKNDDCIIAIAIALQMSLKNSTNYDDIEKRILI